jgi:NlpC/P60 family
VIWHRIWRFLRRHRESEELLAGSFAGSLVWALVRQLLFGSAVAGAAVATSLLVSQAPGRVATVAAPQAYAVETVQQRQLVAAAKRYGPGSGIVYWWGGSSPLGFDCSGYVWFVHGRVGITIPRGSRLQWSSTAAVDVPRGRELPGDAVYFVGSTTGANAGPPPGHEGLYVGGGQFIEYYSSGLPAHYRTLASASDYMGAKRWWTPVQIPARYAGTVRWLARYFGVKIASSKGYRVVYKPWRGSGRFDRSKRRRIVAWAHRHHHPTAGDRSFLAVTF